MQDSTLCLNLTLNINCLKFTHDSNLTCLLFVHAFLLNLYIVYSLFRCDPSYELDTKLLLIMQDSSLFKHGLIIPLYAYPSLHYAQTLDMQLPLHRFNLVSINIGKVFF